MSIPENVLNPDLYEIARDVIYKRYKKPSAYRSSALVKYYRDELGGKYIGRKTKEGLVRWHNEEWTDIGQKDYPVYRPTRRVNKKTPLLVSGIDPKNLKKQIALKQKIKGDENLPAFLPIVF